MCVPLNAKRIIEMKAGCKMSVFETKLIGVVWGKCYVDVFDVLILKYEPLYSQMTITTIPLILHSIVCIPDMQLTKTLSKHVFEKESPAYIS